MLDENNVPMQGEETSCSSAILDNATFLEDGSYEGVITTVNLYHVGIYYPATQNVYNFVRESHDDYDSENMVGNEYSDVELNFWPNIPRNILKTNWLEVLHDVWTRKGAPHGIAWNESNSFSSDIYYEEWMTMDEWAASEYNIDGWTWTVFGETNGALVSADGQWYMIQYYIKDANGESHRCTMGECMEETSFYVAPKAEVEKLIEKTQNVLGETN